MRLSVGPGQRHVTNDFFRNGHSSLSLAYGGRVIRSHLPKLSQSVAIFPKVHGASKGLTLWRASYCALRTVLTLKAPESLKSRAPKGHGRDIV